MRCAWSRQIPGAFQSPSLGPLMQGAASIYHRFIGPWWPGLPTACKAPCNYFTLCSNGGHNGSIPNRSPKTFFQTVYNLLQLFFPFPWHLYVCKHHARGLEALFYLKYVNTCQLWTLSIWECFSPAGKKAVQLESVYPYYREESRFKNVFLFPSGFYLVRVGQDERATSRWRSWLCWYNGLGKRDHRLRGSEWENESENIGDHLSRWAREAEVEAFKLSRYKCPPEPLVHRQGYFVDIHCPLTTAEGRKGMNPPQYLVCTLFSHCMLSQTFLDELTSTG